MLQYLFRRLLYTLLTLLVLTLILSLIVEMMLPILGRSELGTQGITQVDIDRWLQDEGFRGEGINFFTRFWDWIAGFFTGDLGVSYGKNKEPISNFLWIKLANTGKLISASEVEAKFAAKRTATRARLETSD